MKPGDRVDRYLLESELGRGGMGAVFEAFDERLGRRVALKLILDGEPGATTADGEMARERMRREARAAAAFEHPNAVVVYDVGEHEGTTYLAMELVRGRTLRALIGDPSLPMERRVRWLVEVARALAAAHAAGLVHRDIKPDNVMIREDGRAKVLDFGIARRTSSPVDPSAPTQACAVNTITERGLVVGTPRYASPEQLRGDALDGRSDQFSWAVVAVELLTGRAPWTAADSVNLISQILSVEVDATSLHGLPAPVVATLLRALSKKRDDRFADMGEIAAALEPSAEELTSGARASSVSQDRTTPASVATAPRATTMAGAARKTGRALTVALAVIGGLFVVALIVAGTTGHLVLDVGGHADAGAEAPVVAAIACADAKLEGDGTPELARALGVGACARLAMQIGAPWSAPAPAPTLEVRVRLGPENEAVLSIAGRSATAKGATPLDAVAAASLELSRSVRGPVMTQATIKAWGASDEASARRVERMWLSFVMNLLPDPDKTIADALAVDGASPWPHALAAFVSAKREVREKARARAIELTEILPPVRARGLRAVMRYIGARDQEKAALQDLRACYAEDPNDPEIAGLYAALAISAHAEEGFSIVDRLAQRFPTRSIVPLNNAISAPDDQDDARDERYLAKLHEILPETAAWSSSVWTLASIGHIDQARAALAFGDRLGLGGAAVDAANLQLSRMIVAIADLKTKEGRELARELLGDPRPRYALNGSAIIVASYWLEGRVEDALEAERKHVERSRALVGDWSVAGEVVALSWTLKLLGRAPLPTSTIDEAERSLREAKTAALDDIALGRVAIARARADVDLKKSRAALRPVLEGIEREAAQEEDRTIREGARLATLPLVRAIRGDVEAAKLVQECLHAKHGALLLTAIDAGIVLEKTAPETAIARYRLAIGATNAMRDPVSYLEARLRLSTLLRALGRTDEAAKEKAKLDAILGDKPDPALLKLLASRHAT
jgi:hypothetical protein